MYIPLDSVGRLPHCHIEVVCGLEIHPELRCHGKIAGQPQCRISRDAASAINDLAHSRDGYAEVPSESVNAQPEWFHQVFAQDLTGMHWRQSSNLWHQSPSR